ncbi:uncharacterized protein [Syngnathus scovelli]|uniref:uncharacterized protein n=1 Tax=Syngnathus scovelli TaxID=161590 RepID=UPI0021103C45|nr:uncharacterized protein LOC125989109 [Syngnathus scovelli]XP_049611090.1 uncharacterized protein LOC125989109 [Syngnathus scovelli]XP_049611091.1 uncharacterized protein LOC125989109 [Syngnathus scovelli]
MEPFEMQQFDLIMADQGHGWNYPEVPNNACSMDSYAPSNFGQPKLQTEHKNDAILSASGDKKSQRQLCPSSALEKSLASIDQWSFEGQNSGEDPFTRCWMDSNMTNPIQIPENKKSAGYQRVGHHSQAQKSSTKRTSHTKERHNCRERERRKKIRSLCDELNLLVPFCETDTDTISTLKHTCAFLKYIRATYANTEKDFYRFTCQKSSCPGSQYPSE